MKWLFNLFKMTVMPPRWRIIHDPDLGYCAQELDSAGWASIDDKGRLSVYNDSAHAYPSLWFETEAEAGALINMRSKTEVRRIVWTGN